MFVTTSKKLNLQRSHLNYCLGLGYVEYLWNQRPNLMNNWARSLNYRLQLLIWSADVQFTSKGHGQFLNPWFKQRGWTVSRFRVPVQTSDGTNLRLARKRRIVQTSDQYKRRTSTNVRLVQTPDSTNVGLRKKCYLNFKIFLLKSYFILSTGLI